MKIWNILKMASHPEDEVKVETSEEESGEVIIDVDFKEATEKADSESTEPADEDESKPAETNTTIIVNNDELKEEMSSMKDDVNSVNSNVSSVNENVDAVKKDVSSVKENVASVQQSLKSVTEAVDDLKALIASGPDISDWKTEASLSTKEVEEIIEYLKEIRKEYFPTVKFSSDAAKDIFFYNIPKTVYKVFDDFKVREYPAVLNPVFYLVPYVTNLDKELYAKVLMTMLRSIRQDELSIINNILKESEYAEEFDLLEDEEEDDAHDSDLLQSAEAYPDTYEEADPDELDPMENEKHNDGMTELNSDVPPEN